MLYKKYFSYLDEFISCKDFYGFDFSFSFFVRELLRELSCDSSTLIQDETDRILVGAGFIWGVEAAFQFPDIVTESVRKSVDDVNAIREKDFIFRKDFRKYCVFTIDPSTARDLDDALHIRQLEPSEIEKLECSGYRNAFYEVNKSPVL